MKFTLSWLKQHLDTTASVDEITYALTDLGLEVEGVEDRGAKLADFTIGKVVSAEKHPDADRLRVSIGTRDRHDRSIHLSTDNLNQQAIHEPLRQHGSDMTPTFPVCRNTFLSDLLAV